MLELGELVQKDDGKEYKIVQRKGKKTAVLVDKADRKTDKKNQSMLASRKATMLAIRKAANNRQSNYRSAGLDLNDMFPSIK